MIDFYGNYFSHFILKICIPNQIIMILNCFNNINIAKIILEYMYFKLYVMSNQIHEKLILSFIERNEIEMAYHSNVIHVLQKIIISFNEKFKKKKN